MLKKTFFQIHWFLGITAGLILSLMGVTGAIYSYEQQILRWINTESYTVQVEPREKLNPAEIYQHFQKTAPDLKINSITIAAAADASSSINVAKEGARRGHTMMINPYSAELLPEIKGREFFAFVQQLHRNLTVGPIGKQITGACTLMLIFFVLSGIYLRWPKRHSIKQWLYVKPKLKGRNFIWDLHAVVGTWVIVFYLIFAMTGLYWSYDWWRNGMFKVLGVERPQPALQAGGSGQPNGPRANGEQRERGEHGKKPREEMSPIQIEAALAQSWIGFEKTFTQQYSSATLNLPKKADGQLELSFVDVDIQHERARNNATYNYKEATFTEVKLYEDKKLNEKIMSSMLPVHRGSFFGPVYQFVAMLAALAMPLFFVTGWMLYLKRRKQKRLTLAARASNSAVAIDPNATPWLIVYASQTGVSEQLAWRTATSLQQAGQPTTVKAMQQLSAQELQSAEQVLIVASTYGTGDAPDLATGFVKKVMSQSLALHETQFAVLALGSQEYAESYCSFGHQIFDWMTKNGATALFPIIEVDNQDPIAIQKWNTQLAQATQLELSDMQIDKTFDRWTLSARQLLNPNSLGQPAYHIELTTENDVLWHAGDIAEIQPANSQQRIKDFIQAHQLNATDYANILKFKNLTKVDQIDTFSTAWVEDLAQLPSREYSIASIPADGVLRLVVRQQQDQEGQLGLGSGWLTQHTELGDEIALRIRHNESFHLIDDDRPIICIGNGTGIAGLMSLLSERATRQHGKNWLIFGERQREKDFFYQEVLEAWKEQGVLQRLDLAFSRDQAEKLYVHHLLSQHATELKTWLDEGAVLYVCGSIQGMATDVDEALTQIIGIEGVEVLRSTGRYRRDVY